HDAPGTLVGLSARAPVVRLAHLVAFVVADGSDAARDGRDAAVGAALRLHLSAGLAAGAAARDRASAAGDVLHPDRARDHHPRRHVRRSMAAGPVADGNLDCAD